MDNPNLLPTSELPPVKPNNLYKHLFFFSLVIIAVMSILLYLAINQNISELKEVKNNDVNPISPTITAAIPTKDPTSIPLSTLQELDKNNNIYKNNTLGFSLTLPKVAFSGYGDCKKEPDSYRPAEKEVPITVLQDQSTFYITGEYYNKLTGEQKIGSETTGYRSTFSGCQKEPITLDLLKRNDPQTIIPEHLKFYMSNVNNDNQAEEFIKSKYGVGCKLGPKIAGTNDVEIIGDGKSLDTSDCPINFIVRTKYNPSKGKIAIFELGQACNIVKNLQYDCYDSDIVDSFKFN